MADLLFEKIKLVDQKTKDLVAGFIRNSEQEFNENAIIPSSITTICTLFYYLGEFFADCGKNMVIENEMKILKIAAPRHWKVVRNTGYGNVNINNEYNCIYSWTLKLVALDSFNTYIGIDSSDKEYIDDNFSSGQNNTYYLITSRGVKSYQVSKVDETHGSGSYGREMEAGDVIKMEINTKDTTMEVWINNQSQGIAFKDIAFDEVEYHFAISLCTNEANFATCVELVDFKQIAI